MFQPFFQVSYRNLLHEQHRYYTKLLIESHRKSVKQYKRLAELELTIAQRHENNMPRKEKKWSQWSRAITKKAIKDLEQQQVCLHEYLRQCGDLITSYDQSNAVAAAGRWIGHLPPIPYPNGICPMVPSSPFGTASEDSEEPPKYWDLSMLRERGGSSGSYPSEDSGYEPPTYFQPSVHSFTNCSPQMSAKSPTFHPRQDSFQSENDPVAELGIMSSPTRTGAEIREPGRRRYSENAIQLIESRLDVPKSHKRIRSVEQIPRFDRISWGSRSDWEK